MRSDAIKLLRGALAAGALAFAGLAQAAATITIVNGNAPDVGFNDPTPVPAVGGNPGLTLGQQRLNAFQYAASIWAAQLTSSVEIKILASFEPLSCTANSAVLGSAGPRDVEADFPGAPVPNTWYHVALANKLAGQDLFTADIDPAGGGAEIRARFNSRLGLFANCLPGSPFYLGLDGQHGTSIDLIEVLLHEFAHGLGFSTTTFGGDGTQLGDPSFGFFPSIYDHFAFDNTQGKTWASMTDAERVASAVNPRGLVWSGANVAAAAPKVLVRGTPELVVEGPKAVAGTYLVGAATFGPPLAVNGDDKRIVPVIEAGALGLACAPFDAANQAAVRRRIAMVSRGACTFTQKVLNAQAAGAVAVIVVDNVAGSPPASLGGADPAVTIPSARITLADGQKLLAAMQSRPGKEGKEVEGRLGLNTRVLAGADRAGRVMLFTPDVFQPGSSVSHWDTSANRNLLMEPAINADLTQVVAPPNDLTLPMFKDIGW